MSPAIIKATIKAIIKATTLLPAMMIMNMAVTSTAMTLTVTLGSVNPVQVQIARTMILIRTWMNLG